MKETASQPLSAALFRNPTSEYRGAPFWAWNGRADDHALMQQQIDTFQAMGFGGFHIHARIGLSSEYMGKDFMESVKFCHEYAQRKDMLTYLYDEDKWPSGYGAGRVTGDPKNRARYLLLSPNFYENGHLDRHLKPSNRLTENGDATLLRRYQICLRDGCLASYRALSDTESADAQTWYAYLVVTDPLPWFNNAAYTSKHFRAKLDAAKMVQSMSRVGRCIDNGPMEGFWGILKSEMYYLRKFSSEQTLTSAIEEYIHFYNTKRYQKRLRCMKPMEFHAAA